MLRATLVLALACLLPGTALAETVVSLMVGGSEVRVAVADDFVRLSEKLPTVFALEAAAQPKTNHLLEGFISLADAKRIALGGVHEQPLLEVATMRNVEALDFSAADWAQARPMIAKAIGQVDLKAAVVGGQASADQRLSDTVGSTVAVHFGQVGQPVFYGNDPDSVRFVLLVSATVVANGATTPYQVENAGAIGAGCLRRSGAGIERVGGRAGRPLPRSGGRGSGRCRGILAHRTAVHRDAGRSRSQPEVTTLRMLQPS
jgi:hypothetical protein